MKDEVNRISKDTEYNSKSLLDGLLDTRVYTDNANVSRVNISDYVNPGKYEILLNNQPQQRQQTMQQMWESNLQVQVQLTPVQFPSTDTSWILTKMIQRRQFLKKSVRQQRSVRQKMKTDNQNEFTGLSGKQIWFFGSVSFDVFRKRW